MKTFLIDGWYRYKGDKHVESIYIQCSGPEKALALFKEVFLNYSFYKIEIKQTT
jgi:hypothetical protein